MTNGVLRKTFVRCGYRCNVRMMPAGHLCGYVFVTKDHPLYGLDKSDWNDDMTPCSGMPSLPKVNGGITWSEQEGLCEWGYGFDYGHSWNDGSETVEEVEEACKDLAIWLRAWELREFVWNLRDHACYGGARMPDAIELDGVRYVPAKP